MQEKPWIPYLIGGLCAMFLLFIVPIVCAHCQKRRNRRRALENNGENNGSAQNFNMTDQPNGQMQRYPGCNQQQQKRSRGWRPFQFRQPQPEPYFNQPQPQKLQQPQQLNNGVMAYNQQSYPNSNPYQLPYQQQPQQYPPFPQQSNLNKEPVKF